MRLDAKSPRGTVHEFVWLSTVFALLFIGHTPTPRLIEAL